MYVCSLQLHCYTKKAQPPGLPMCNSRDSCHLVSCLCSTSPPNGTSTQMPSWTIRATDAESTAWSYWQPLSCMTVLFAVIELQRDAEQYTFVKPALTLRSYVLTHVSNVTTHLPTSHSNCNLPFLIYYIPTYKLWFMTHFSHYSWFITLLLLHTCPFRFARLTLVRTPFCMCFVHITSNSKTFKPILNSSFMNS